jgi:hypothetical protein
MLKLLMGGQKPMEPPSEYIQEQMGELVDAVSSYDNSRSALGYSMFYYVNNMYGNNRFKLLAVDDVKPGRDTILSDKYPLGTGYYAVIRNDEKEGSVARKLIDWLLTDEGQAVAIKAGYIPLRHIEDIFPDTEIDPIYLGDYQKSNGTGGKAWKGWDAREELVKSGVKKPLSDVFYNGFNYIEFINTNIANKLQALDLYHTRYMNSDTFGAVLKRSFPGIPNDYPHYSFESGEPVLLIEFPDDNPYFSYGMKFRIRLTKDISPYGDGYNINVSYRSAGQIIPDVNLAKPVINIPKNKTVTDKINNEIQSWINNFGNSTETITQIEWRLNDAKRVVREWGLSDYTFLLEPKVGYWKNYISVSYSFSWEDGVIGGDGGPLLFSICFDLNTGERADIAEKLQGNIDFSKMDWIGTPYWQTANGQRGGVTMPEGYMPVRGSVVTNAIILGDYNEYISNNTMVIYVTEPNGRVLRCIFWDGDI